MQNAMPNCTVDCNMQPVTWACPPGSGFQFNSCNAPLQWLPELFCKPLAGFVCSQSLPTFPDMVL